MKTKLVSALLVIVGLVTIQSQAAVAAPTNPTPGRAVPTATTMVSAHKVPAPGTAAPADVITCTVNAQYPHNSSHVNGTINGVITINCTNLVQRMVGVMSLYNNGVFVAGGGLDESWRAVDSMNAAVSCADGTYHTEGGVSIYFPPGYSPPTWHGWVQSASIYLTCD
jgi:hypothetical protein